MGINVDDTVRLSGIGNFELGKIVGKGLGVYRIGVSGSGNRVRNSNRKGGPYHYSSSVHGVFVLYNESRSSRMEHKSLLE